MVNDKRGIKTSGGLIDSLSQYLFWDADVSDVDEKLNSKYIIKKVLLYGKYKDYKFLWVKKKY